MRYWKNAERGSQREAWTVDGVDGVDSVDMGITDTCWL